MSQREFCIITFAHEEDGLFTTGTLSNLGGPPRATWTFHQDDGQFTNEASIDEEEFAALRNLLDNEVFLRCSVKDEDTEMDPGKFYVIAVMFLIAGNAGKSGFLIPAGENDPVWADWLTRVEATQRPA